MRLSACVCNARRRCVAWEDAMWFQSSPLPTRTGRNDPGALGPLHHHPTKDVDAPPTPPHSISLRLSHPQKPSPALSDTLPHQHTPSHSHSPSQTSRSLTHTQALAHAFSDSLKVKQAPTCTHVQRIYTKAQKDTLARTFGSLSCAPRALLRLALLSSHTTSLRSLVSLS